MVHQIATYEEFCEKVINLKDDRLYLVDFWATWCGPCIKIAPVLDNIAKEHADITVYKVDVDANSETSEAVQISCMPTFKFFKNGVCLGTCEGANEAKLRSLIDKHK